MHGSACQNAWRWTYSLQRSEGYPPAQRLTGETFPETDLGPISVMSATFLPLHPITHSSFPSIYPSPNHAPKKQSTNITGYLYCSIFLLILYLFHSISLFFVLYWYCMNVKAQSIYWTLQHTLSLCFKGDKRDKATLLTLTKLLCTHHLILQHPNHAAASAPFSAPPKLHSKSAPVASKAS